MNQLNYFILYIENRNFLVDTTLNLHLNCEKWQSLQFITFSSWMRRYWFYVKNDFRNFHQIFTF